MGAKGLNSNQCGAGVFEVCEPRPRVCEGDGGALFLTPPLPAAGDPVGPPSSSKEMNLG